MNLLICQHFLGLYLACTQFHTIFLENLPSFPLFSLDYFGLSKQMYYKLLCGSTLDNYTS